jgi:hypothetical protein
MKKTFMFFILVLFVGISSFVYASIQPTEVQIHEGWNLVYGFTFPDQRIESGSQITPENIKAVYLLRQPQQEYIRLYPDIELDKLEGIDDDYYDFTAQWVYSDKSGIMKYIAEEPLPSELWNEHKLFKGWNFLGITSEMTIDVNIATPEEESQYTLNAIKGTCNFEKVYHFEQSIQEWSINLVNDNFMDETLDDDAMNLGLVIKVLEDCNLGRIIDEEGIGPPPIPN